MRNVCRTFPDFVALHPGYYAESYLHGGRTHRSAPALSFPILSLIESRVLSLH